MNVVLIEKQSNCNDKYIGVVQYSQRMYVSWSKILYKHKNIHLFPFTRIIAINGGEFAVMNDYDGSELRIQRKNVSYSLIKRMQKNSIR